MREFVVSAERSEGEGRGGSEDDVRAQLYRMPVRSADPFDYLVQTIRTYVVLATLAVFTSHTRSTRFKSNGISLLDAGHLGSDCMRAAVSD